MTQETIKRLAQVRETVIASAQDLGWTAEDVAAQVKALDFAIAYAKERDEFFRQQKELYDKGGHYPGSDF